MWHMQTLQTVTAVIDAFGGTAATAARFGVLPSAVSNWKAAGKFPQRLHYLIDSEAKKSNLDIDPIVFKTPAGKRAA